MKLHYPAQSASGASATSLFWNMIWGAGVVTALPHGVQLFADFEQIAAHRYLSSWTATGGLRLKF
jgi:hypothetical protein